MRTKPLYLSSTSRSVNTISVVVTLCCLCVNQMGTMNNLHLNKYVLYIAGCFEKRSPSCPSIMHVTAQLHQFLKAWVNRY